MVVDRRHAEESELGFAENPTVFSDNSRVNMYLHHDGYPEWQGVQIANWLQANAILRTIIMIYLPMYLIKKLITITHQLYGVDKIKIITDGCITT